MGGKNRKPKNGGVSAAKKKNIKGGKRTAGKTTKAKPVVMARKKLQAAAKKKEFIKKPKNIDSTKAPESEVNVEDVLQMIDSGDLAYMRSNEYRDKQNFVIADSSSSGPSGHRQLQLTRKKRKAESDGSDDELESTYEKKLVKLEESSKKYKELLPVKTRTGLQRQTEEVQEDDENDDDDEEQQGKLDQLKLPSKKKGVLTRKDEFETKMRIKDGFISYAKLLDQRKRLILEYKCRIGELGGGFSEDPHNRLKNVDALLMMMTNCDPAVSVVVPQLCSSALVVMFQDVLPSYAIKQTNPDGVKLKKDTLQLQNFESALLSKYKMFLKKLEHLVTKYCPRKGSRKDLHQGEANLGRKALERMCMLLSANPYFNMSTNIANFVVPFLNNWNFQIRQTVFSYISAVFRNDKRGEISYQIVRRINEVVKKIFAKAGNHGAHPELLNVLLALRIKEADLEREKEDEVKPGRKMTFEQRRMLSKRQRKKSKELVQLEKELLEASAEENKEQKSHFLTEITKLMFTIYFKVLKSEVTSGLLDCVLEGLSKFAHVINVDFFDDLVSALQNILNQEVSKRQVLLCISTVLGVLDGQGAALNVDPSVFHKRLYTSLSELQCGNSGDICSLALRCVRLSLGKKKMPGPRVIAFAKRLATATLQVEHHNVLGTLVEMKNILRVHSNVEKLIDSEDGPAASGVYNPELQDPDHSCADSSTMWEITALLNHYHPYVTQVAKNILNSKDNKMPPELLKQTSEQICRNLDPKSDMEFFPPLPEKKVEPITGKRSRRIRFRGMAADEVGIGMDSPEDGNQDEDLDYYAVREND